MFDIPKKKDSGPVVVNGWSPNTKRALGDFFSGNSWKKLREENVARASKYKGDMRNQIFASIDYSKEVAARKKMALVPEFNAEHYTRQANSGMNRPTRNKNPLNIKASEYTKKYPGVAGLDPVPASDGGQFLIFNSAEDGFNAAERLLSSENYRVLSVDQAMRRWSNSGYGGEIVPSFRGRIIGSLTPGERRLLVQAMARREGYSGAA